MTAGGTVWGLDTGRKGEFMQVELLGRSLDFAFERIRLSPKGVAVDALPTTPPRLILSFGRAARAGLRLADGCTLNGLSLRPLTVHLGTPGQTPIDAFDLILPMPQDAYPAAPNVQFLRLPLNGATLTTAELPPPRLDGVCTVHRRWTVAAFPAAPALGSPAHRLCRPACAGPMPRNCWSSPARARRRRF